MKEQERKQNASKLVTKYPKSSVVALKAIFDEYDLDGSGCLDRAELTLALKKRKQEAQRFDPRSKRTLAERQAQAGRARGQASTDKGVFLVDFADCLYEALDANSDERVTFAEVLRIMYPLATRVELRTMLSWVMVKTDAQIRHEEDLAAKQERLESLRAMFRAYDRNGDGKVSITEFRMAMLDTENWDEVDELFEQYDRNGNGEVDFDEFCAIVSPDSEFDLP